MRLPSNKLRGLPVLILLVAAWATMGFGPLTVLIIPAVVAGLIIAIRRRAWISLVLLLILNPLVSYFLSGVASYVQGAPALRFVGLPHMESYNIDRSSRCFHRGGGCLISGDEWVYIQTHNSALRLMARWFGPPAKSYDGPYPTKEEAITATTNAPEIPLQDFLANQVTLNGMTYVFDPQVVNKLQSRLPLTTDFVDGTKVQVAIYQDRCLIVRFSDKANNSGELDRVEFDILVCFDKTNMRPFAYFKAQGHDLFRFPPVTYLSSDDR